MYLNNNYGGFFYTYCKAEEDLSTYKSEKTGRGPLKEGWKKTSDPIMCSYKVVEIKLDIWGIQGKVEDFLHKVRFFKQKIVKVSCGCLLFVCF